MTVPADFHYRFASREEAIAALAIAFPQAVIDIEAESFRLYGKGWAIDAFGEVPAAAEDTSVRWTPNPLYHVNIRVTDPSLLGAAQSAHGAHGIPAPTNPYRVWA